MEESERVIWLRREHAPVGRPAQRSRAEITAAALSIADAEGLDAVSMRRVAAELGTGAASLYRYVNARDDLLDLMADAVGDEYAYPELSGDWAADLVAIGEQTRAIMRRHPWLIALVYTRPVIGPNGLRLLEHVLAALAGVPASLTAKLEAFAMMTSITASFVQYDLNGGSDRQRQNQAYLEHAIASGQHPKLSELITQAAIVPDPAPATADAADRYPDLLARILTGLLGSGAAVD